MTGSADSEKSAPNAAPDGGSEIESLRAHVLQLEERMKEGETNFFRSLKTLVIDLEAYRKGQINFPRGAVLGTIFSYLRRPWVIVAGGLIASSLAFAQLWLLKIQNDKIEAQNGLIATQSELLRRQTRADEASALAKKAVVVDRPEKGQKSFSKKKPRTPT